MGGGGGVVTSLGSHYFKLSDGLLFSGTAEGDYNFLDRKRIIIGGREVGGHLNIWEQVFTF